MHKRRCRQANPIGYNAMAPLSNTCIFRLLCDPINVLKGLFLFSKFLMYRQSLLYYRNISETFKKGITKKKKLKSANKAVDLTKWSKIIEFSLTFWLFMTQFYRKCLFPLWR